MKNVHKMRKVTIYRATSRELLLGFMLGSIHTLDIQRPLRSEKDASGDYTLVAYAEAYAHNIHGHDDYQLIRLINGPTGCKEVQILTREVFRNMISDIQAELCPDNLDELDLPVGVTNCLKASGVTGICHLLEYTYREIQKMPGIGKKYMEHIVEGLDKKKLQLNLY